MQHMRLLPLYTALLAPIVMTQPARAQAIREPEAEEWKMTAPDGVKLYVTEFGAGDTVVAIHGGFGAEHGYLLSAFTPFAKQYHFVLYDQRGSLRSDCADSLITLDKHIDDIELLRKNLHLEQLTLVTHSMGGFLAMNYIARYPGRVKKLILLASPSAHSSFEDLTSNINASAMARWDRPAVIAELQQYGLSKEPPKNKSDKERWTWDRITFAAINLHDVTKWKQIKGGPLFYSNKAGTASIRSIQSDQWNFTEAIAAQNIPVYILHGDDDYLPYTYHNNWKERSRIRFYLIKDAGRSGPRLILI
ncbi:MAG: alpha/beta hydrolase [Chitinophagaceae bacterium]|nr:alpha/beta hydrolase [Chitinophagaceae bacterium]